MIQRREFITLPGGAAAAWPSAAWGQQSKMPLLGLLGGADPVGYAPQIKALRVGLRDFGYIEGQTIAIEYRWAEGRYDRLPALVADLVRAQVAVIITQGTPAAFGPSMQRSLALQLHPQRS
jgi:putative ABC transport system substrate-binding protein